MVKFKMSSVAKAPELTLMYPIHTGPNLLRLIKL